MTPVDYRNETWASVQPRVKADHLRVWAAFKTHGPATTREIAEKSGISIFTLRPRASELYALGFLEAVHGAHRTAQGGVYRAVTQEEAQKTFEAHKAQLMAMEEAHA